MAECPDYDLDNDPDIDFYRELVQKYINLHAYNSAQFWAEKVVTLSSGKPRDVYWLAQTMFLQKEYHRAVYILSSTNLHKSYYICTYLTARCLYEINKIQEAFVLLDLINMEVFLEHNNILEAEMFDDSPKSRLLSCIFLLKGKVWEARMNQDLAFDCYVQALQSDVHCFEAFGILIKHNMMTPAEEVELINSLPIHAQCTLKQAKVLLALYTSLIRNREPLGRVPSTAPTQSQSTEASTSQSADNSEPSTSVKLLIDNNEPLTSTKTLTDSNEPATSTTASTDNNQPSIDTKTGKPKKGKPKDAKEKTQKKEQPEQAQLPDVLTPEDLKLIRRLTHSLDLIVAKAQIHFDNYQFSNCIKLTQHVLKDDPYHSACLILHIGCLVELKHVTKLFTLAHDLVKANPNLALSWYAVACYYYMTGKDDEAQKYLEKSLTLDNSFGPAWLALGHLYGIRKKDHVGAVQKYTTAILHMRGSHLPLLYMGMECSEANSNVSSALFHRALSIKPDDPQILQELGVDCFRKLEYAAAEMYLKQALDEIYRTTGPILSNDWGPLLNNIGHACRKLQKYDEALYYHHQALVLMPQTPTTYSSIAFVHTLKGNKREAIEWFHKALIKDRDIFSSIMLDELLVEYAEEELSFSDGLAEHPPFLKSPSDTMTPDDSSPPGFSSSLETMSVDESSPIAAFTGFQADILCPFESLSLETPSSSLLSPDATSQLDTLPSATSSVSLSPDVSPVSDMLSPDGLSSVLSTLSSVLSTDAGSSAEPINISDSSSSENGSKTTMIIDDSD